MKAAELKDLLEQALLKYNTRNFIESDPVQIPHRFRRKEDIEIAGFFAASLAWGKRSSILNSLNKLLSLMDEAPFDFILQHEKRDLKRFSGFVHRTFNAEDCVFFIRALRDLYTRHGGLEQAFSQPEGTSGLEHRMANFRQAFLRTKHMPRSTKHLSDPLNNSSAKRLCMYLRWMVRKDQGGIDLGIWKSIKASELCLPLDVHTGFVSRKLGLLKRQQNDWKAVKEVTEVLRSFDPADPVKYDLALFGLGVEGILK